MSDVYARRIVRTVDHILKRFGKDATVIKVIPGAYNPATGSVGPATEVRYAARAVENTLEVEHEAGTLIEQGEKAGWLKVTDEAFDGEITLSMKVQLAGDRPRTVTKIYQVEPGLTAIYWRFRLSS